MARMIPLYSASLQSEIERRARELFELGGRTAGRAWINGCKRRRAISKSCVAARRDFRAMALQ